MKNIDHDDPSPKVDPFKNVKVEQFVAMNSSNEDKELDILFFLRRVSPMKNVSLTLGSIRIIWYWPKPTSQQDDLSI